jgi:hypothetical protein
MAPPAIVAVALLASVAGAAVAEMSSVGTASRANSFACSPGQLHSRDKLTIRVSVPHGTDLGIRSPANDFFFIYSCDPSIRSSQWKDFDCENFASLTRITIDVADIEASSQTPHATAQRVFSQSGVYTILLAKNLQTENTTHTVNRCKVQYHANGVAKP